MIEERYELALDRIRLMQTEDTVGEPYRDYFKKMAEFVLMLDELRTELLDGRYQKLELDELRKWNRRLYQDVLPGQYEKSYANPDYACKMLGKESGQILGMLYAELRGAVVYVFEGKTEYLAILYELLIEVYNQFEEEPDPKAVRDTFYWYASDYCDVFLAERIREQVLPEESFTTDLIMNSDLTDLRYLYQFGEYISENEWKTAEHLNSLPEETIRKMADVYTEGYRIGFVNTGKDLSKKSVVNIRYILGFERVVKKAIENFEKMGLKPVIYRAAVSVLTKRQHIKIGYYGAVANKQYEYDHKDDQALFMDKKYLERKLEVMQTTYEHHKKEAAGFAGPACIDMFGEEPFEPEAKETVAKLSKSQEEMILQYDSRQSQMVNQYIKGEERSFTIIAYPVPEIGENFPEIFREIVKINTLDYKKYQKRENEPMSAYYYYKTVGVINEDRSNMPDSQRSLPREAQLPGYPIIDDRNGDGKIDIDDIYMDNTLPKVYYGFGNTFTYKNFDLDIYMYGQLGVKKFNSTHASNCSAANLASGTLASNPTDYAYAIWNSQTNPNGTVPGIASSKSVALPENAPINTFWEKASFLRVRNITLGYNWDTRKLAFLKGNVQTIRLFVDFQNPFTLTKFEGDDPEITTAAGNLGHGQYPQLRVYSFGAKISF